MRGCKKAVSILLAASGVLGVALDWVNPYYAILPQRGAIDTSAAQNHIVSSANIRARDGPWALTRNPVNPPSGDKHDYLSWAPYSWPDCNWCPRHQGKSNFAPEQNDNSQGSSSREQSPLLNDPLPNLTSAPDEDVTLSADSAPANLDLQLADLQNSHSAYRASFHAQYGREILAKGEPPSSTTTHACRPSPTTSMPPSATWTSCPYASRDGQVNPDTREMYGVGAINNLAETVIGNALAAVFTGQPSYFQTTTGFIEIFFLDSATAAKPSVKYGQFVRGPDPEEGRELGILDFRGIVKVANAVGVLRGASASSWTRELDSVMVEWFSQYADWLDKSDFGAQAKKKLINNHATFYYAQRAAAQLGAGHMKDARASLDFYFTKIFTQQIAPGGEQPFEAVRTRPFHYRCFNVEAMLINAKMGDQLGADYWSTQTRHGETIQSAVDFLMSIDPKEEDITELAPHVAAIAAVYGDPRGKYSKFLQRVMPDYKTRYFWFYDQPSAFNHGIKPGKVRIIATEDPALSPATLPFGVDPIGNSNQTSGAAPEAACGTVDGFDCPPIFCSSPQVVLDPGVYTSCDEVRNYYLGKNIL